MRINFERRRNKFLIVSYEFIGRYPGREKVFKKQGKDISYGPGIGVSYNFRTILWSNIYLKRGVSENIVGGWYRIVLISKIIRIFN